MTIPEPASSPSAPKPAIPRWPDAWPPEQRAAYERWAQHAQHHLLPYHDPRYPPLLRQIADPPPLLFVRGNVDVLSRPQLAIVGSRRPTADGRENARRFAAGISAAGYVVTSGLALGIDAEAHRGTLEHKGITIAVLGTGLDNIYPVAHTTLAAQIAEHGAVISEFAPEHPSYQSNFPQRNRIISGLAHGVLVVEAAQQSGSLITARCAGEQGREVFAVPGTIHNPYARGCHRLIRQGAKLVDCIEHILEELPALVRWERECGAITHGSRPALTPVLRKLLGHIAYEAVPVDTLLKRSGTPLPELYANLMQLELGGYIVHRAGGYVLSPS
ncbi:MAG TPA: DNA-processing protein DprA [Pseudomonadales bacterium]